MLHSLGGLLAAASDPGSKIGQNIEDMLQGLAAPVWAGLVGIMALAFLAGRKISQLAVYVVVALGVGVLILNADGVAKVVTSVGDAITKGV